MSNWSELKKSIESNIGENGKNAITGQLLQNVLKNIVSNLGENANFAGGATPETNPGTPDGNVFYFALKPGVYPNFDGINVESNEIAFIIVNGNSWAKLSAATTDIVNDFTTGGADKALSAEMGKALKASIPTIVNDLVTGGADKALSAEMGKVLKNGSLPVLKASDNMLNNAQHTGVYIIDNVEDSPGKGTYYMCFVRRSSTKIDDYAYCIEQVIYSLDDSIPEVFSRIGFVTEDGVEFGNWNSLDTTSLKEQLERSYEQGSSYEVGIIKSADGYRSYPLEKIFFSGTLLGTTASSATATLQVSDNYIMPYSLQGSLLLYKGDGSFQIYLLKDMEQLEYEFTIEDGILLLRLDAFPIFDTMSGISRVQYFVEVTTTGLNVLP